MSNIKYSIVIPAKNEEKGLELLIPKLLEYAASEIIVVSDGSSDRTQEVAEHYGCKVIVHEISMGNGAAIKAGAREACEDVILFMDADYQHDPKNIPDLLETYKKGRDMVVGARQGQKSQANIARGFGNKLYNKFASWMVGQEIHDLTSGFRVVNKKKFLTFLHLLPNGFSYPTTITMAFFRAGYKVEYFFLDMPKRIGKSHLNLFKDGPKFFLIIFKIGTLYSPLKIFMPIALAHLILGLGYYTFTYITEGRFTNMSALLLSNAVLIFLIGLVSEQIANLTYKP